jgi:hypothetical protein
MKGPKRLLVALFLSGCSPAPASGPIAPIIVESAPDAGLTDKPVVMEQPPTPIPDAPPVGAADQALRGWSKRTLCPNSYDYFPHGGIQSFWCHRPESLTVTALRQAAGGKIFASGPHSADDLVLDAKNDFGHYDPAFVKWLTTQIPDASTPETKAAYDRYLKSLAHVFWQVLGKTKADKACFDREKNGYADLVAKKKLPADYYERWFYFMNPLFCSKPPKGQFDSNLMNHGGDAGYDGNVTKTVTGFWIRRSIDGTYDGFAQGLEKFLKVFDPDFLAGKEPSKRPQKPAGY